MEQTYERIIKSGISLFFKNSYFMTTVDNICEHANIARGTFYIYFKNKADLLEKIVYDTHSILYEATENPWRSKSIDRYHRLEKSIQDFFVVYCKHKDVIKIWLEVSVTDKHLRELWDGLVSKITKRIELNIERSIEKSVYRKVNPTIAAKALSGMVEQYAYTLLDSEEHEYDIEEISKTLADLWHNALIKRCL